MFQEIRNILTSTNELPEEINDVIMSYVGTPKSLDFESELKRFKDYYKRNYTLYIFDIGDMFTKGFFKELAKYLNISNLLFVKGRVHHSRTKYEYVNSIIPIIKYVLLNKIEPIKNIHSRAFNFVYEYFVSERPTGKYIYYTQHFTQGYVRKDYINICKGFKTKYKKTTTDDQIFDLLIDIVKEKEEKAKYLYKKVIQQIKKMKSV